MFIGTFYDLSIIRRRGGRRKPSAPVLLGHQANIFITSSIFRGGATRCTGCSPFSMLLPPYRCLDTQCGCPVQQIGNAFWLVHRSRCAERTGAGVQVSARRSSGSALFFDKGIDICRRCFQLLQPLRFRWDRFLQRFLFRIIVS